MDNGLKYIIMLNREKAEENKYYRSLLEKFTKEGVDRSQVGLWTGALLRGDELLEELYSAGIKDYHTAEKLKRAVSKGISLSEILTVKEGFEKLGMKEEEVNMVLSALGEIDNWQEGIKTVNYLYRNGIKEHKVIEGFLKRGFTVEKLQELVSFLKERDFTQKESLYEIWYVSKYYKIASTRLIKEIFEEAQKVGFKTASLAHSVFYNRVTKRYEFMPIAIPFLKERVSFYHSLGLSSVDAEWWTKLEEEFGVKLSEKEVQLWIEEIDKSNPSTLERAFYLMSKLKGVSTQELIRWYKTDIPEEEVLYWKEKGFTPEKAQEWYSVKASEVRAYFMEKKGITPQDFRELLSITYCSSEDLEKWLSKALPSEIKEWASLGVKDYLTYWKLKIRGFTKEKLESLLKLETLEKVLSLVDNGYESYEEVEKELLKKWSMKTTVKLFQRKIRH